LCQVIRKGRAAPETAENIAQRRGGARELGKHYRRELSFHGQTSPRGVSASNATLNLEGELLSARSIIRPLNPGHMRHVHRGELWMKLAHRGRRPL
jgi:hypothetical protein